MLGWGEVGGWRWGGGWKMGLWIFLSWNGFIERIYFSKSVNSTFSAFYNKATCRYYYLQSKCRILLSWESKLACNSKSYSTSFGFARREEEVRKPPPFAKNGKWFLLPLSIGLERVVEIPILPTKQRNLSAVSFWGKQTPTTGVDKWQARWRRLNKVSSLTNENSSVQAKSSGLISAS